MTHLTIKNRWTGDVLFEGDFETMALCVVAAVKSRANLSGANLSCADLSRANLSGADLSRADLSRADLPGANLSGANLSCADLSRAYLSGADLSRADLSGANLSGADLSRAYLSGAIWREGFALNRALVRTAQRGDGYTFYLLDTDHGWMIAAGCRFFTPDEAWAHWEKTRLEDDVGSLGAETRDILTMFELAMERGARS